MSRRDVMPILAGLAAAGAALLAALALYYVLRLSGVGAHQRSLAELEVMLAPHIEVVTPQGVGPFPAVVMFHGCGGRRPMHDHYAAVAVEAGYAAIIVDSFTPREIDRTQALTLVCSGAVLMGRERAGDVAAALDWARRRPEIDADRLIVAGWSHGGWSILDLMTMDLARGQHPHGLDRLPVTVFDGVQAAFLIYPYCRFPALARERWLQADLPIHVVFGAADTVIGQSDCVAILEREREGGRAVSWEVWPDLTHAFDDDADMPPTPVQTYDAEAAARLHAAFGAFIRRWSDPDA